MTTHSLKDKVVLITGGAKTSADSLAENLQNKEQNSQFTIIVQKLK